MSGTRSKVGARSRSSERAHQTTARGLGTVGKIHTGQTAAQTVLGILTGISSFDLPSSPTMRKARHPGWGCFGGGAFLDRR